MKTVLGIQGMTCENCVRHVTEALREVRGVTSVEVSLAGKRATIEHDAQLAPREALAHAVAEAGYELTPG